MTDTTPEPGETEDPENPDVQHDPADEADQDAEPTTMAPPGEGPDDEG